MDVHVPWTSIPCICQQRASNAPVPTGPGFAGRQYGGRRRLNNAANRPAGREVWLDLLRGLALLFVIYGHQVGGWYGYFLLTSAVKIPLFFAITGYLFNEKKTVRAFLKALLWRLLIPWLGVGLLAAVCRIPAQGTAGFRAALVDFARGRAAWYIPCCVVAELVWFAIRRALKSVPATAAAVALCCAAGLVLARRKLLGDWMINRALIAQVYLLIGLIFRRYLEKLPRQALWGALALAVYFALAALSARLYPGRTMDVHRNRYYSVPLCLGMAASGCWALFWLFRRFAAGAPAWLGLLGRSTLVVYLLHNATVRLPRRLLSLAGFHRHGLAQAALMLAGAVLLVCGVYCLAAVLIGRFAPVLAGKGLRRRRDAAV